MNYRSDFDMKNFLGLAIFGLVAAGIGAAATMFAIKKREELDAYDDFDDEFCDDCDCNCEECAACEDILLDDEDISVEEVLDSVEEDIEEIAKEDGEDF